MIKDLEQATRIQRARAAFSETRTGRSGYTYVKHRYWVARAVRRWCKRTGFDPASLPHRGRPVVRST